MTPWCLGFIPGSLENTDKHIEVADGHHVKAKQNGQVQIKMCDDNGDSFILTLHNVLLALDPSERLFTIITFITLGHTFLFHKRFCTVYFGNKEKIRLLYHILDSRNMHLGGNKANVKIKENST